MKKTLLLFSLLFSSLFFSANAENVLTLTNPRTQETEVFRKGSFMVFELRKDNTVREGFIREIQDSSLSFEDQLFEAQVGLSEVRILAGSTKAKVNAGKVAGAVGDALVLAGMTVFDCGLDFFSYGDYYYWPLGGSIWIAGAAIAGIGYIFDWAAHPFHHSVRVRNYKDWNAQIVRKGDPVVKEEKEVTPQDTVKASSTPVEEKSTKKKKKFNGDDVYGD